VEELFRAYRSVPFRQKKLAKIAKKMKKHTDMRKIV